MSLIVVVVKLHLEQGLGDAIGAWLSELRSKYTDRHVICRTVHDAQNLKHFVKLSLSFDTKERL